MCYNQEKYIVQSLESIIMQKTNFNYEIVVGDDFSTDDTLKIIMNYKKRYPDLFNIINRKIGDDYYQKRQKFGRLYNFIDIINNCKGKYIALMDGDDYWTNPYKLQKQVDVLEKKQDYVICFHKAKILNELDHTEDIFPNKLNKIKSYTIKDLISGNFMHTPTLLIRKLPVIHSKLLFNKNIKTADWLITMLVAQFGKIYYLPEIMAVYRIHEGGLHSTKSKFYKANATEKLFEILKNYNNFKFLNLIKKRLEKIYISKIGHGIKNHNCPEIKGYLRKLKALKENNIKYFIVIMHTIIILFGKMLNLYVRKFIPSIRKKIPF